MAHRKLRVIACKAGKCPKDCKPCDKVTDAVTKCCRIIKEKEEQSLQALYNRAVQATQARGKKSG